MESYRNNAANSESNYNCGLKAMYRQESILAIFVFPSQKIIMYSFIGLLL
jgi:hypothetical protein